MTSPAPHILITGASSGIGAALALDYAAPGVRLSLHGRSVERLASVQTDAEKRGAVVTTHGSDVTDTASMSAWINAMDQLQPLTLVIANAGVSQGSDRSGANFTKTQALFAINWDGTLNTIHPAIACMVERKHGQIAIVSSLAGFRGFSGSAAYCASKAALRIYGEGLRAELAPQGVKINIICPGFVKTPMTDVNQFPMPFLMDAARAARIIRQGLHSNRAQIAFPWQMSWLVRLVSALPLDWVSPHMSRKRGQTPV